MTRWNKQADLITVTVTLNDEGSPVFETSRRTVFCNQYVIGAQSWLAARSAGLHADFEIEIRSYEYNGEQVVEFDGVECQVERVSDTGEFTRLLLKRRVSNE